MQTLVTGSAGHLGEALVRTLRHQGHDVVGLDIKPTPFTDVCTSVTDVQAVAGAMAGVKVVYHTATLHKPHVATHTRQDFVDTNVSGTLALLEAAVRHGVGAFVFTSTTSAFGAALNPPPGAPAAWITEAVQPVPKNIYGATKTAAEALCELFHRAHGLPCIVLRTSRFFPEVDDDAAVRDRFGDGNVKANEFLYRRVDIEDVVTAHLCAAERAAALGFGRYIISATTPFQPQDAPRLGVRAPEVLRERVPQYESWYRSLDWRMFDRLDRVYDNTAARRDLGWQPRYDFPTVVRTALETGSVRSPLAALIGEKGYHDDRFAGTYPLVRPRV